jgi:hypothetical protein
MKKLTLQENYKEEFLRYCQERILKCSYMKNYDYLTESILKNTFDFFFTKKLTVEENAKSYWTNNNQKEIECYGYSGYSINDRDDLEGIKDNLFHEIFCKAEWVARSLKEDYKETCKAYYGSKNYNLIIA